MAEIVDPRTGKVVDSYPTGPADEPYYGTRAIPGVADAETDALFAALDDYRDFVNEHGDILSDAWQARALAMEQEKCAAELRENGAVDDKRPTVLDDWTRERPRILARLDVMRDGIRRLDNAARKAIREQVPAEVGPATLRANEAVAAYEAAIAALARAASDAKAALKHAHTVQTLVATGHFPRNGNVAYLAFGGGDDIAVSHARDALMSVRQSAARILHGGVRYVPGQTVTFSLSGGRMVERVLDAEGASRMNANNMESVRLLLELDKSAVPVMDIDQ
ncbi:hypothetical protein [Spirillospora sp. NPDC029432]|uniref:hypothetical protein n=1 Tax=Spirillospora sp. NPDC029432 TaxID=3154599 RepID=UPI0034562954